MEKFATSDGPMTAAELIESLSYRNYAWNRRELSAECLASLFPGQASAFEARYQREQGGES
jgi:hypothetical protein